MAYKDIERERECQKAYYIAHKNEIRAYQKAYYATHKEEIKAYCLVRKEERKAYRLAHREEIKQHNRQRARKLKLEVLCHYSTLGYPNCQHCGETDIDVLCIDHVNNDGIKHRKSTGLGHNLYNWLKKNNYPEGYQTLCANCNLKKEIELRRTR